MSPHFVPASPSTFRRIAAAMWSRPSDPTIYGYIDLDATSLLERIAELRAAGVEATVTHLVTWAVARAFAEHPEQNARVRLGGKIERRTTVDLVVSVATGTSDLSAARVEAAEQLTLPELVAELRRKVSETRRGDDSDMQRSRSLVGRLPWFLARPALRLADLVGNELDLDLPGLGMPRDPFGTAVITNVGMFGIDTAFAPFVPMGRSAMLLLVTEIRDRPVAIDGQVVVRPVLRLCASFDHRVIDGRQAGALAASIREALEAPAAKREAA